MSHLIQTISWKFREAPAYIRKHIHSETPINSPEQVYISFRKLFENEVKERFVVIWLNAINCVIGYEVVTEGILNSSLVHPREVFRGSIVVT
jgi:DNA repair protein RadC